MRVAAIDCGTNTIKLLIADLDGAEQVEVVREMRMVRLGEGVDRSGRLGGSALQRVFGAMDEYAALIEEHAAERTRFCATSAVRDAENADEFAAGVRERLGVDPEVLSGDEEARLSFAGATRRVLEATGIAPPYLVVDIGGGSTELILGGPDGPEVAESLDIGSVRLTERHVTSDPIDAAELDAVAADVEAALDATRVPLDRAGAVIGVAGSITTTAAMVMELASYDRALLDGAVVGTAAVQGAAARLAAMTVEERKALGFMHPGRADVIVAGALILDRVLRRTPVESLLVSESDILDGIAWSLVG